MPARRGAQGWLGDRIPLSRAPGRWATRRTNVSHREKRIIYRHARTLIKRRTQATPPLCIPSLSGHTKLTSIQLDDHRTSVGLLDVKLPIMNNILYVGDIITRQYLL